MRAVRWGLALLFAAAIVAANAPAEASSHEETADLTLPDPMTPSAAQQYAMDQGAEQVLSLRIEYVFQGTVNTLTVPTHGDLPEGEVLGRATQTVNNLTAIRRREGVKPEQGAAAAAAAAAGQVTSDQIIQGRRDIITGVEITRPTSDNTASHSTGLNVQLMASCDSTAWLPTYHYAEASGAGVQGRYIYQDNEWGSTRMANLKCNGDTFEAEFKTYNYDGGHYFSLSSGDVLSTNCNFPRCYLDTGFSDSNDEPHYTMGSANIDDASSGVYYTTYIQVRVGNVSVDSGKTQGQTGHRIPDFCYSTWCIFGLDTKDETPGWWTLPGSVTVNR